MRLVCGVGPLILVQVFYREAPGLAALLYAGLWGDTGPSTYPPPPRSSLSPQMIRSGSSGGPEIGREGQVNTPEF